MKYLRIALIWGLTLIIYSCASMYGTPENRRLRNESLSEYELCEYLATDTFAPNNIRSEWALELQKRGTDCQKYAGVINSKVQQSQNLMNMGLILMQGRTPSPITTQPRTINCTKKREWTSGLYKNCVYDCVGNEAVQTMRSVDICPLLISREL